VARKSIFTFIHIIHQHRYMIPVSTSLSRTYFITTVNSVWRESQDTVQRSLTPGLLEMRRDSIRDNCRDSSRDNCRDSLPSPLIQLQSRIHSYALEEDAKTEAYTPARDAKTEAVRSHKQTRRHNQNTISAKHFGTHEFSPDRSSRKLATGNIVVEACRKQQQCG
jgi:hypothetical protein